MKQMTFQKACFVSMIIHILLFGSAIAVAGYSKGALWRSYDIVTVSLGGLGMKSGAGASLGEKYHDAPATNKTGAMQQKMNAPVSVMKQAAPKEIANVHPHENNSVGGQGAALDQQGSGTLTASGSGGQSGLMPEKEWAAIASAIEHSKNYPRMARERGIQGVVLVRFKLRTSGEVDTVEIVKSSGHDILDSASIRTVYRAAPMPYINGWVELPISYILH